MSSAICSNLGQSKILLFGNGLNKGRTYWLKMFSKQKLFD